MMDPVEKEVLRDKKQTIATFLRMDASDIRHFSQLGMLTPSMRKAIQAEEDSRSRAVKFLTLVRKRKKRQQFDALVSALDWGEYSWLADELDAELRLARGELPLDDVIAVESGVVVRRALNITKRISEGEKRLLENLVTRRATCTQEVWRNQVLKAKERQARENLVAQDVDAYAAELGDKVQEYLNENEARVSLGPGLSTQSTTMLLLGDKPRKKTPLKELQDRLDQLMRFMSQAFLALESARKEKNMTLQVMELEGYGQDIEVDKALEYALEAATKEKGENHERAKELEFDNHTLNRKATRVERELTMVADSKDQDVNKIKNTLLSCVLKMQQLADVKAKLNNQLYFAQEELKEYKHKVEKLERSKRLVHLYPDLKEKNALKSSSKKVSKGRRRIQASSRKTAGLPQASKSYVPPDVIDEEQDTSDTEGETSVRPISEVSGASIGSPRPESEAGTSSRFDTPDESTRGRSVLSASSTATMMHREKSPQPQRSGVRSARPVTMTTRQLGKSEAPRSAALTGTPGIRSPGSRSPMSPEVTTPWLPSLGATSPATSSRVTHGGAASPRPGTSGTVSAPRSSQTPTITVTDGRGSELLMSTI